jgi:hypothetical protein
MSREELITALIQSEKANRIRQEGIEKSYELLRGILERRST